MVRIREEGDNYNATVGIKQQGKAGAGILFFTNGDV